MFPSSRLISSLSNCRFGYSPRQKIIHKTSTRMISLDKLPNKKITRLESDIELDDSEHKPRLINRNPRNLEQLAFEKKPVGFWMDTHSLTTYNKLILVQNGRYLNAYLTHWSGKKLIQASTREPQLSKFFGTPNTTQAAIVLAKVMARRCLQAGFICAGVDEYEFDGELSLKTKTFFETVESSGVKLGEPPEISPRKVSDL